MKSQFDGEIRLGFTNRSGRTVAQTTYRRGNSRISGNIPAAGDVPYYFLISTGGGFTEGETYLQEVSLGEQCHAIVTTQTPNYIYKCDGGRLTSQNNRVEIGKDSFLEYYIDETIPYARARFRQNTEIQMAPGSRLIMTDGLTAGWSEDEEPFQYRDIGLKTDIRMDGRLLFHDFLLVNPEEDHMHEIGCFEGSMNYNSAVIIDEGVDEAMLEELRNFLNQKFTGSEEVRFGLSLLDRYGLVLRVLGKSIVENREVVYSMTGYYREKILGYPHFALRKNA